MISLKQNVNGRNVSSTSPLTISLAATTAGNLLVVAIGDFSGAAGSFSVSDNASNTWHSAVNFSASTFGTVIAFYAYNVTASGTPQVTVTPVTDGDFVVTVMEFSGVATSSDPFDKLHSNGQTGTTAPTSGSTGTTATGDELLLGLHLMNGIPTITAGTGFSSVGTSSSSSPINYELYSQWQEVTSTGAYAAACSTSASVNTTSSILTFRAKPYTGTGAVSASASLSGSGSETFSGTAAVAASVAMAASGFQADNIGAGASSTAAAIAASGTLSFSGTGAPHALAALSGSGTLSFTSTGAVTATARTAATGSEIFSGTAAMTSMAAISSTGLMYPPLAVWPRAKW